MHGQEQGAVAVDIDICQHLLVWPMKILINLWSIDSQRDTAGKEKAIEQHVHSIYCNSMFIKKLF